MKSKVDFRLLMITDRKLCKNLPDRIAAACNAGVKAVLFREKDSSSKDLRLLWKKIKTITSRSKVKLIFNTDQLSAALSFADGFHLPECELLHLKPFKKYNSLAGISVHSKDNAIIAEKMGFDYILFGPVYRTPAKVKYGPPMGLKKLKEVCNSVKIPVFAVGGIDPVRAGKCIQNGAYGVAVIRELMLTDNIKRTVNEFNKMLRVKN
jgi:thiamine-phosphate pyrophosphorylase